MTGTRVVRWSEQGMETRTGVCLKEKPAAGDACKLATWRDLTLEVQARSRARCVPEETGGY